MSAAPEIKPRTQEVPLFQGGDLARIKELSKAVESALGRTSVRRLGEGSSDATAAAAEHDAFVEEAKARAVIVTIVALGRRQWRDLVLKHPPREGDKADEEFGFNVQDLGEDLVCLSLMRPGSSPRFDAVEGDETGLQVSPEAVVWVDQLAHADFQRIFSAAYLLNEESFDPKADHVSRVARIGEEISTSPSRLAGASES